MSFIHSIFRRKYFRRGNFLGFILISTFFFLAWSRPSNSGNSYHVTKVDELRQTLSKIQPGDSVTLAAGIYELHTPIILDVDNITLQGVGDGTILRLADGANCPVIFVGVDEPLPSRFVSGVKIRRLLIDGNRKMQTTEHWRAPGRGGWFTNNGITFRQVRDSSAEDIRVHSTISGGIVFAHHCEGIELLRITSWNHAFDGIAWDGSVRNSVIADSLLYGNDYSGISWDIDVEGNSVLNTISRDNGKTGLFLRASSRNTIRRSSFIRNEDGVFIADGDKRLQEKGSIGNVFEDCVIANNTHTGIWQAGENSVGNALSHTEFRDNGYRDTDSSFPTKAPIILQ